jgi:hypothetical protein
MIRRLGIGIVGLAGWARGGTVAHPDGSGTTRIRRATVGAFVGHPRG